MPATQNGLKTILLAEIRAAGDTKTRQTTDAILSEIFDTVWDTFSASGLRNPQLQYLYTKRQVIEFWRSSVWRDTDYEDDVRESLGQMSRNLDLMAKSTQDDIDALERSLSQSSGGVVGLLATTATHAALTGQADPNHPGYRGDPRYRGGRIR